MAQEIEWSERAKNELFEILYYWTKRNKSKTYSEKLNGLVLEAVEVVAEAPETGVPTKFINVRIKIVRDYLVYYRIHNQSIEILAIWDSRRNPKKFRL
jgi:plasmid stabilization system protein ParE